MASRWQCQHCGLWNAGKRRQCQACFEPNLQINHTLLNGYFRANELILKQTIPRQIRFIITRFVEKWFIFAAGRNKHGQLGLDHVASVLEFTRLSQLESLVNNLNHIYGNDSGLIVQHTEHQLYVAGLNSQRQLGLEIVQESERRPEVDSMSGCFNCGRYGHYARDCPADSNIHAVRTWTQIIDDLFRTESVDVVSRGICNSYQTFFTTLSNKLYVNGGNNYGCFGDAAKMETVKLFRINTEKWLNSETERIVDIQCGSLHTLFQTASGQVYAFGNNESQQCLPYEKNRILQPVPIERDAQKVCCGDWFSCILTKNGEVRYFGDIVCAVKDKRVVDVKCGARHALFLDETGNVYSVGTDHSCGQRGYKPSDDGQTADPSPNEPYLVDIPEKIMSIECGGDHSVVLSAANNLYCFGYNAFRQCMSKVQDENIFVATRFDKDYELGYEYLIEKVVCLHNETLIIVDPFS